VYKAGDYFTYKVEFSVTIQGQTCTIDFTYRLDIVKIEMNTVTSNQTIKDVKTTDACPWKLQLPFYEVERYYSIDKEPGETFSFLAIYTLPFLVDPSYSEEFRTSAQDPFYGFKQSASLKYSKGVLLSGSVNYDYGEQGKISINVELIDSSVAEFKSLLQAQLYMYNIIGAIVFIAIIGVVVGVGFYISRRRRGRSHLTPPQPQSPPPPPTPSI
jgi:hypothetical protein